MTSPMPERAPQPPSPPPITRAALASARHGTLLRAAPPVFLALLALGLAAPAAALDAGLLCERTASTELRACVRKHAWATRLCHRDAGAACPASDARVTAALATLESRVLARCPDPATVAAAGYPASATPASLVERLREACTSASASLAARSFGGPHAGALAGASAEQRSCLDRAFVQGRAVIDFGLRLQSACVRNAHAGRACDATQVAGRIATRESRAAASIEQRCTALEDLVAVDAATFVARASAQARCLTATAHGDTAPLALDCGSRATVPVPPRATNTQIVLDEATWGTRCGDGSPYAFWIRLAPAGSPVGNVVVHMQGGGVCIDGPDCAGRPANLFEALGDGMAQQGYMSSSSTANPFRSWTKVFLPYCTQDVHIGGGATNAFAEITVHRYGALNVRAALRWVRDALWAEMDAADPEGFRPDRLNVVFAGSSAGGYGAVYNYHYVLDDLRWVHTAAVPDSALGLDNGEPDGVAAMGALVGGHTTPGWGARAHLAPYCFAPGCAVILPTLEAAHSARLRGVAEQQILNVSNQIDDVQRATQRFASTADFVDTLRAGYCAIQGMPGVHSFLAAQPTPIHGVLPSNSTFPSLPAGTTTIATWLSGAFGAPDDMADAVVEGSLVADYPGVSPFPCALGSASQAFLDPRSCAGLL